MTFGQEQLQTKELIPILDLYPIHTRMLGRDLADHMRMRIGHSHRISIDQRAQPWVMIRMLMRDQYARDLPAAVLVDGVKQGLERFLASVTAHIHHKPLLAVAHQITVGMGGWRQGGGGDGHADQIVAKHLHLGGFCTCLIMLDHAKTPFVHLRILRFRNRRGSNFRTQYGPPCNLPMNYARACDAVSKAKILDKTPAPCPQFPHDPTLGHPYPLREYFHERIWARQRRPTVATRARRRL